MGGADVIENSEILADGMIAAAAFLLLREVERRMEGGRKQQQVGGADESEGGFTAEKHCSANSRGALPADTRNK